MSDAKDVLAKKLVEIVLLDFGDRRGLKHELRAIDPDVMEDLVGTLVRKFVEAIDETERERGEGQYAKATAAPVEPGIDHRPHRHYLDTQFVGLLQAHCGLAETKSVAIGLALTEAIDAHAEHLRVTLDAFADRMADHLHDLRNR